MKDVWRSAIVKPGEQSVMTSGVQLMLECLACSLDMLDLVQNQSLDSFL